MKKSPAVFLFFLFCTGYLSAQQDSIPQKVYHTKAIKNTAPAIDGLIDEPIWNTVDWGGDFIQLQPYEKEAPSQETAFKILYDEKNLYVAFRCFDTEPDKIVRRMSRRDGFDGDWVEINIDSYFDKRTAFSFTISVSGVKGDEFVSNDGSNWDSNWNPIWFAKTNIDSLGWTAELKIPLSQIRYGAKDEHTWGIQFTRRDFRASSRSIWQYIPQNSARWVSGFGVLKGLFGLKPQKQIEVQPYVVGKAETFEKEEGNPFATGNDQALDFGLDGKIGVTGDLTLDFTINPDFGQVEADPSALNLDGFRIFFSERRPFFIENRNLFEYRFSRAEAGGPFTIDNLFYSRRIGRSPHGYPDLRDGEYADVPGQTTILGAAKFSGKTQKGLGIGILESVTAREVATIDLDGERREEVVEPLSNYFVGRITQDFRQGQTVLGGIFTAVNRDLTDTNLGYLHESAYTGGLDLIHWMKDRTYFISANSVFSKVNGSTEAITETQTSFEHYFQRPDATHLSVDTSATSLLGHGGTIKGGKLNGNWKFEMGTTWRSPELELNDIGFMVNADEINYFFWTGYQINEPVAIWQRLRFNYNHWSRWDFSGKNLYQAVNVNHHGTFKNFWGYGGGLTYENLDISNNGLFGGPALRKSRGFGQWFYMFTDNRKKLTFNVNINNGWGFDPDEAETVRFRGYSLGINYQPINSLNFSVFPSYNINQRKIQYVTDLQIANEGGEETRYITGAVDQRTFSMTMRLNYSITPDLSIQYYGQPFISRGRYDRFNYIKDALAANFHDRVALYKPEAIEYIEEEELYEVDEDLDGTVDYSFDQPDFNFIQFRSNLVARWEYIPGSELFLVWSQNNTFSGDPTDDLIPSLTENIFTNQAQNIFLIKLTYRFLL